MREMMNSSRTAPADECSWLLPRGVWGGQTCGPSQGGMAIATALPQATAAYLIKQATLIAVRTFVPQIIYTRRPPPQS